MIINGLNSNGYYVNNPIYIEVIDLNNSKFIDVTITNITTSAVYKLYPDMNGKVLVDLSSMIRVMMPLPVANNTEYLQPTPTNTFSNITIRIVETRNDNTITEQSFSKMVIRGGLNGNKNNVLIKQGTLTLTDKMPVWKNKPCALYICNSDYSITKRPINTSSSYVDTATGIQIEQQTTRYVNGVYLKFLNSLGGYSYWLFESSSVKRKTDNIGYYVTPNLSGEVVTDMGQTVNDEYNVTSVVKVEYINIIKNLITSHEVYQFNDDDNSWERIILDGNSITTNPVKKVYDVNVSYKSHTTYTPTTLI